MHFFLDAVDVIVTAAAGALALAENWLSMTLYSCNDQAAHPVACLGAAAAAKALMHAMRLLLQARETMSDSVLPTFSVQCARILGTLVAASSETATQIGPDGVRFLLELEHQ